MDIDPPAPERSRRRTLAIASLGLAALLPLAAQATTNIYYAQPDHLLIWPPDYYNAHAGSVFDFRALIYMNKGYNFSSYAGPVTLDTHTTWTTNGKGYLVALPGNRPGNNGNADLDLEVYHSVRADAGHVVTVQATYHGGTTISCKGFIYFNR